MAYSQDIHHARFESRSRTGHDRCAKYDALAIGAAHACTCDKDLYDYSSEAAVRTLYHPDSGWPCITYSRACLNWNGWYECENYAYLDKYGASMYDFQPRYHLIVFSNGCNINNLTCGQCDGTPGGGAAAIAAGTAAAFGFAAAVFWWRRRSQKQAREAAGRSVHDPPEAVLGQVRRRPSRDLTRPSSRIPSDWATAAVQGASAGRDMRSIEIGARSNVSSRMASTTRLKAPEEAQCAGRSLHVPGDRRLPPPARLPAGMPVARATDVRVSQGTTAMRLGATAARQADGSGVGGVMRTRERVVV